MTASQRLSRGGQRPEDGGQDLRNARSELLATMEQTFIIVKPDAVQRGLVGEVLGRLERRGLKLVACKMLRAERALVEEHYAEHAGKGFYEGLVSFLSSSPVVAAIFEGPGAIAMVRTTIGATNPLNAAPGTVRGDLAVDFGRNIIHASDGAESATREIALWFGADAALAWERSNEAWIIE